jgi:diketogulonate reductase-like aldo/keto reductase
VCAYRRGLEALVDAGLTKAIGLSNASLPQVEEILAAAKHKPAVNQVRRVAPFEVQLWVKGCSNCPQVMPQLSL